MAAAGVLIAAVIVGCAQDATGPSDIDALKGPSPISTVAQQGLLRCTPRRYAVARALIGPRGGEIKIGHNEFKVPRNSLTIPTLITMELPSDTVNSVRFSPEGLIFNPRAQPELKLDFANCAKLPHGFKPKVAYTTESLRIIETLQSSVDSTSGSVGADLKHFSRYAISY
jgi:hypothetical protein